MKTIRIILAVALLALAAPAFAQPYVTAGLGVASIKTTSGDAKNGAWSFGLGYRISKIIAVEAVFTDFGNSSIYSGSRSAPASSAIEGGSGLGFSAVASLPISQSVAAMFKVGAQNLGGNLSGTRANPATENIGWTSTIGAGMSVGAMPKLQLRAMIERVAGKGSIDSVTVLSAGIAYAF